MTIRHSRSLFTLSFFLFCFGSLTGAGEALPSNRLSPTNLLIYHDHTSRTAIVKSRADWQKRRAEIVAGTQTIMGKLPGKERRCRLDLQLEDEMDCGSYVRKRITYAPEPCSRTPAYLLIPKICLQQHRKRAAILALHPTDMEYGHRVVVESLRENYPPYAHELAARGFVVLAPAYPLMANYQPDLKALGYQSGTMKAIWDNIRGLDLLESLPFVKKGGFGAIGHSLGGHNSIFTACFDKRIKIIVSSCGFDSFRDYMNGDIRGWTSERYMPKLLDYGNHLIDIPFDFYELIGALAPRHVFISAPSGDSNFKWSSVDEITKAASQVYNLHGARSNLVVEHPDCGHEFPDEVRYRAYGLLDDILQ